MAKAKSSKKPAVKTETNGNHILSLLEKKLLGFAESGKHVLLYGKDTHGRKGLIEKIHVLNGGVLSTWEYVGEEKGIESRDDLIAEAENACINNDRERAALILSNYLITERSYEYIDFGFMSADSVFVGLNNTNNRNIVFNYEPMAMKNFDKSFSSYQYYVDGPISSRGLLFIDNLQCNSSRSEDHSCYKKIAILIERDRKYDKKKNNWLIAYTYDPKIFPPYFLDQFEMVSLNRNDYEVKEQKEKIVIETTNVIAESREGHVEKVIVGSNKDMTKTKGTEPALYKKTPVGAKWQDLTMAFPKHLLDKVDITFKGNRKDPAVHLKVLGFLYKRSKKKFKDSWKLLITFAKDKDNILDVKDTNRNKLYTQVDSLRNDLKHCFGIDENPILGNKGGGYQLQFKANYYDKEGEKKLLNNLRTYLKKLKNETNKTKSVHNPTTIKELKELIYAGVEKYLETNQSVRLEDIICTECYEKIPSCIIDSDNLEVLCNECNKM
jgi:hypothetical protein